MFDVVMFKTPKLCKQRSLMTTVFGDITW